MADTLRIATRQSPMAMFQANQIKAKLLEKQPSLQVELVGFTTKGDRELSLPLQNIGGKSLFVKELQKALLENRADIAVHCVKDMSVQPTPKLILGAICKRDDPRDAFISNEYQKLSELPKNAIIGTSSPRRQCLIKHLRPDLQVKDLRGNVNTRLKKLDDYEYDAIILAAAGLERLDMSERIREYLPSPIFVPAIGQGALGIECREDDAPTLERIKHLNHKHTAVCVIAERAVNKVLGGSCYTPLGAHAVIKRKYFFLKKQIILKAFVGSSVTGNTINVELCDTLKNAKQLGKKAGEMLLNQGAGNYLNDL